MTTLSGSTRRMLLLAFILGCLVLIRPSPNALAQETPQYTVEEYGAFQGITGESDPAKKMELILHFFKAYPKSTLKQYIVSDFQGMLKTLQDAKRWTQVITVGRQFLTVVADDAYTVALVAAGYSETKNYQQFVVFGEESYKTHPTGNLAYNMAKAYKSLGNTAKFLEWADRTVQKLPDNYEMFFELARYYGDAERYAEADKYSKQCLKAVQAATKPAQTSEKDWATYTRQIQMACYYIIGSGAYKRQDYANAISNLENSLKFNPRNDTACYFLGMSYWQTQQRIDRALVNFAKASLLGGAIAATAKQQLENLYKQTHRGSLVGLEKVIAVAKAELK